jgi:anti-anti-sigma factor
MPQATFRLSDTDGFSTLEVSGELDLANVTQLSDALERCIDRRRKAIIISLSQVSYFDSVTARALFHHKKSADAHGTRLMLIIPPRSGAQKLAEILGFADVFELCPSIEDAVARVDGSQPDSLPDNRIL